MMIFIMKTPIIQILILMIKGDLESAFFVIVNGI
jgi:hypothetical protein